MELDFITENSIIYVLIAWVAIIVTAKVLKLERYGFELKSYSLVYKKILKEKIKETHPYQVPEIAEIDISSINQPYLKWLIDSTS